MAKVKVKGGKSSKKSINISKGIVYIFFTVYLVIYGIVLQSFIASYQKSHPGELAVYVSLLTRRIGRLCKLWFNNKYNQNKFKVSFKNNWINN